MEDWRALITFQQMIILSDADGVVDITPRALSRRTGIPIDYIEAGIKILESPDVYSRSPDDGGKRIVRLDDHRDWGWRIVNHNAYRNMKDHEGRKEYKRRKQRQYDEEKKEKGNKNNDPLDKNVQPSPEMSSSVYVYVLSLYKNVDKEAWDEYESHRQEIKKPLTKRAAALAAKKLESFSPNEQRKIVNRTIESGWTGLFPQDSETPDFTKGAI